MMTINLSSITVDLNGWNDRTVIRWEDEDGNRYRFQTKPGTMDSKFGYIEKDPPKDTRGMDYHQTRRLDINTKASQVRIAIVRDWITRHQLIEKGMAKIKADEIERLNKERESSIAWAKKGKGTELYNHLRQLVAAQRRATTAHALDGLCDEAEGLLAQIEAEIAEINAEADASLAKVI